MSRESRVQSREPRVWNRKIEKPPAGAVYVGRGTPWGNPWSHLEGTVPTEFLVESRGEALRKFSEHLEENPELVERIGKELLGRDLVCSCVPLPCHGQILLRIANGPSVDR